MNSQFNSLLGVPSQVYGMPNILYVGAPSASWTASMLKEHPNAVYYSLDQAISACPKGDGENTFGFNGTTIIFHSQDTTLPITIPLKLSGLTIIGIPGSTLGVDYDLGGDNALITIEGYGVTLTGISIFNLFDKQDGTAIRIGNDQGAGLRTTLHECSILGDESGVYSSFKTPLKISDGKYSVIKDCLGIDASLKADKTIKFINTELL